VRRFVAIACLLAQVGCYSHRHPYLATTVDVGLGTTAAGVVVATWSPAAPDPNCDGPCNIGLGGLAGIGLMLAGAAIATLSGAAFGIVSLTDPPEAPTTPPALPSTPIALGALPALATDAQTLQLAKQARMAAARRQCTAARLDLSAIGERDRAYHDALAASAVFDACR